MTALSSSTADWSLWLALFSHLRKFGLEMHVGRGSRASKTEAMYCPKPHKAYGDEDTGRFMVDGDGFIEFTREFKYLGSIISTTLTSDADVDQVRDGDFRSTRHELIQTERHIPPCQGEGIRDPCP
jgi:hypothetical protein